jgi:hypothetical protein
MGRKKLVDNYIIPTHPSLASLLAILALAHFLASNSGQSKQILISGEWGDMPLMLALTVYGPCSNHA